MSSKQPEIVGLSLMGILALLGIGLYAWFSSPTLRTKVMDRLNGIGEGDLN